MQLVGAGLNAEIDNSAGSAPVLRRELVGLHAEFLSRVHRRNEGRCVHLRQVQSQALHHYDVGVGQAPVRRKVTPGAVLSAESRPEYGLRPPDPTNPAGRVR